MQYLIKGSKINLRKIRLKDANKEYLKWLNDKETNKFMETRHYNHTIKNIKHYITEWIKVAPPFSTYSLNI